MAEEFLPDAEANVPPIDRPIRRDRREAVRIIVVGSNSGITNIVYTLFVKEFAEIHEWSDLIPEPNTGKLMRVVTKYVCLE